jgi:hypothetical protein
VKARDLRDRLDTLETVVSSFLSRDGTVHSQIERNLEPPREDNRYDIASDKRRDESIQGLPSRQDIPTLEAPHLQEAENGQLNYIDPSHWLSILEDIKEVQEHLSASGISQSQHTADRGTNRVEPDAGFLFNTDSRASLAEILTSLPSQSKCDMLLSWYFESRFMILGRTNLQGEQKRER